MMKTKSNVMNVINVMLCNKSNAITKPLHIWLGVKLRAITAPSLCFPLEPLSINKYLLIDKHLKDNKIHSLKKGLGKLRKIHDNQMPALW